MTTPIQGTVSYHKARTSHGQPVYKLAVPANLTASHGVQNSKMSHVTLTMPLSGIIITIIIMVYLLDFSSAGWDWLWSTYIPNMKSLGAPVTKLSKIYSAPITKRT